jgi:hypothetical protein
MWLWSCFAAIRQLMRTFGKAARHYQPRLFRTPWEEGHEDVVNHSKDPSLCIKIALSA